MSSLDPEPCDDCDTGIQYIICFDGVRRCTACVWEYAVAHGWDRPPEVSEPEPQSQAPSSAPLSPMERKALRDEKRERAKDQQTLTFHK
jgi:hypothetical protein